MSRILSLFLDSKTRKRRANVGCATFGEAGAKIFALKGADINQTEASYAHYSRIFNFGELVRPYLTARRGVRSNYHLFRTFRSDFSEHVGLINCEGAKDSFAIPSSHPTHTGQT